MDAKIYEALTSITKKTRTLLSGKYGHRKRLNQSELWEQATLYRDIVQVENWLNKKVVEK